MREYISILVGLLMAFVSISCGSISNEFHEGATDCGISVSQFQKSSQWWRFKSSVSGSLLGPEDISLEVVNEHDQELTYTMTPGGCFSAATGAKVRVSSIDGSQGYKFRISNDEEVTVRTLELPQIADKKIWEICDASKDNGAFLNLKGKKQDLNNKTLEAWAIEDNSGFSKLDPKTNERCILLPPTKGQDIVITDRKTIFAIIPGFHFSQGSVTEVADWYRSEDDFCSVLETRFLIHELGLATGLCSNQGDFKFLDYCNLSYDKRYALSWIKIQKLIDRLRLEVSMLDDADCDLVRSALSDKTRLVLKGHIEDLRPLAEFTQLESLSIQGNIKDIEPLRSLVNLKVLRIDGQLSDASALESLNSLTYLGLANNQLKSIPKVANPSALVHLYLTNNPIEDLSGIDKFTGLKFLSLSELPVRDLSFVEGMPNLAHLSVRNSQLDDLTALSHHSLTSLDVAFNKIEAIDSIKASKDTLMLLLVEDNLIQDISMLSSFSTLSILEAKNNPIIHDESHCPTKLGPEALTDFCKGS